MDDNAADFEVLNYSKGPRRNPGSGKAKINGRWKLGHEDIVKPEKILYRYLCVDGEKERFRKRRRKQAKKSTPERRLCTFLGWYLEDQKYDFETPVSTDITLCAKWEERNTNPDPLPDIDQSQNQSRSQSQNQSRIEADTFRNHSGSADRKR